MYVCDLYSSIYISNTRSICWFPAFATILGAREQYLTKIDLIEPISVEFGEPERRGCFGLAQYALFYGLKKFGRGEVKSTIAVEHLTFYRNKVVVGSHPS